MATRLYRSYQHYGRFTKFSRHEMGANNGIPRNTGAVGTGPHLNGVVGRNHAASAGFGYSDPMKALAAEVWTPEALDHFLPNPKAAIPGTKKSFDGLPKAEDRANLIAYLATLK